MFSNFFIQNQGKQNLIYLNVKKSFFLILQLKFFFIESYKEYNQIECKYKNDKLKDLINLKAFIRNLVK